MTEDERRNRNPAVERQRVNLADHPIVTAAELERYGVYLIQSAQFVVTLNYVGTSHMINRVTLDSVLAHHFHGPRAKLDIYLTAKAGGKFEDATGNAITVRRWTGEDA